MQVTILGSGTPIPEPKRAGTSLVLRIGGEPILIDCGPGAFSRLLEENVHPANVNELFFTHQHMDHNAAFFEFAIRSWMLGREHLTVYGPDGTEALLDSLEMIYGEDIEYRKSLGRETEGIEDIEYVSTSTNEFEFETDQWRVRAMPVEHSIETHAYRFDEFATDASFVFSGDTCKVPELADFASNADVLIHDAPFGPIGEIPTDEFVWSQNLQEYDDYQGKLREVHSTPAEAGQIAAEAGVSTLVLTHITPYRDTEAMCEEARDHFDGTVIAAEDGLRLASPF
jgi:ribonuclease BN (tRNA processing enzyme)